MMEFKNEKHKDYIKRFLAGETMQEIADSYGFTRQAIFNVLKKYGITAQDGGKYIAIRKRENEKRINKEKYYEDMYSYPYKKIKEIKKEYGSKPFRAYKMQSYNALNRNIAWELSFREWWELWQKSEKWDKRGCYYGQYVMARNGDTGPYRIDNVKIVLNTENIIEYYSNTYDGDYRDTLIKAKKKAQSC